MRNQSVADEAALEREEEQVNDHVTKLESDGTKDGKLIMAEEVAEGHVSWSASMSLNLLLLRCIITDLVY